MYGKRSNPYNARQPWPKRQKIADIPVSTRTAQINQAKELMLLKRKVRKMSANTELKCSNSSYTAAMVNGGGPLSDIAWLSNIGMSDIAEGTGDDERIGDTITVKRIKVKGIVETIPANKNSTAFRIILFRDKQHNNNSAIAAAALYGSEVSLLQWQASGPSLPEAMLRRHENMARYQVYRDIVLIANPAGISDYDPTTGNTSTFSSIKVPFSFDVKIPEVKVHYKSAIGDNTGVNDNMFQLAIASVNLSDVEASTISCSAQLYYEDN